MEESKQKKGSEAQRRFEKIYNPKTGTASGYRAKQETLPNTNAFEVCKKRGQEYVLYDVAH